MAPDVGKPRELLRSQEEWVELIDRRLHGTLGHMPLDLSREEDGYYPFVKRWRKDTTNRINIEAAVSTLLHTVEANFIYWSGEPLHELLLLVGVVFEGNSAPVEETLLSLAKSEAYATKTDSAHLRLHCRLLQTLVSIGANPSLSFWQRQRELRPKDNRVVPGDIIPLRVAWDHLVFTGLMTVSIPEAFQHLGSIPWEGNASTWFPHLILDYVGSELQEEVQSHWMHCAASLPSESAAPVLSLLK